MTFLHSEFFYWMLPPIALLFYFWQTQKSPQSAPFSEHVLDRLRSSETTMSLRGRNALFLIAAILLIAAMAQPVIFLDEATVDGKADVLIALDLSKKSHDAFAVQKRSAIEMLRILRGENISLVGYDTQLYRISPFSTDTDMMVRLIKGLDSEAMVRFASDSSVVEKLKTAQGLKIIIGDPIPEHNTRLSDIPEMIEKIKKSQCLYAHIPLFYYPLGLAMLLIWMALSSMSKRKSVPFAAVLLMVSINSTPSSAGILDFRELKKGYSAYEQGDYRQSVASFKAYQKVHDSPEIRYNLANALYKAGEYQEACYWYRQVFTTDHLLVRSTAYNLGLCEQQVHHETQGNSVKKAAEIPGVFQKESVGKQGKQIDQQEKTRLYPI